MIRHFCVLINNLPQMWSLFTSYVVTYKHFHLFCVTNNEYFHDMNEV